MSDIQLKSSFLFIIIFNWEIFVCQKNIKAHLRNVNNNSTDYLLDI